MGNLNGDDHSNGGDDSKGKNGKVPGRAARVRFWPFMFFLFVYGSATAPFYWPYLKKQAAIVWADDLVQDIGTVQRISFIGGLGIGTQIETETSMLLVRRMANLSKGTLLQSRDNFFRRRICVAESERCWEVVGE